MSLFVNSMNNFFKRLLLSFTKDSLLAGFFFFLVLCSWYILRPVRNEMAVQNADILPYLLGTGALVMLLLHPFYSWLASRKNLKGMLRGCYLFFVSNLAIFIFLWEVLNLSNATWLGYIFYIWCNVFSFFIVSIFWVVIINLFRGEKATNVFGVIAAGGSLGALLGSEISKRLASTFTESGVLFFTLISICFLLTAMEIGIILLNRFRQVEGIEKAAGGTSLDAIKNLVSSSQIRSIALYMYLWTTMMTIHWITSVQIVKAWSNNEAERIVFFSSIEQSVTILTLFTQFFLTSAIIRFAGPKNILMLYGFLFIGVFIGYYVNPSISYVFAVTVILRLFEYGINKPTREVVFTYLKRIDRYKSSVLVETFFVRFGDFSGSIFILLTKSSIAFSHIPMLAIPFAGCLAFLGFKITPKEKISS
jgi:AAA family ATP:ADP antiporter